MMKIYLPLLLLTLTITSAIAQIQKQEDPKSLSIKNSAARVKVKSIALAEVDNEAEMVKAKKLKEEKCKDCRQDIYGKPIAIQVDIKKDVSPVETEEGYVWRYKFDSKSAKGLQFYFDKFKLPKGATLHFYNDDLSYTMGAFTHENNNPSDKFATRIFPGKSATLEYFEPKNAAFKTSLRLNKVVHVFLEFGESTERAGIGFGISGSCAVNVNCASGSVLSDVKKAVGLITYWDPSTGYNAVCTGSLINSTGSDTFKKSLFMSAGHCVSTSTPGYYFDYIFYFNYENTGCTQNSTNPFYDADSFQGAYLRSIGDGPHLTNTDYALLELYDKPQDYASVYYLGWDRRSTVSSGGTFNISHPWGDAKKIAIDYESPVLIHQRSAPCISTSPLEAWKVDWNEGITQPASSGSPLLNGFKRLIGVLSGGDSRCTNSPGTDFCGNTTAHSGPDWFTRLDYSWNHSNPASQELFYYLDPANTNPDYIDGYNPAPPSGSGFVKINSITLTSSHWEDGPKLVPQISNSPNAGQLSYSWTPSVDIFNPNEAVAILFFGGNKPNLPITRTYTLNVTSTAGFSDSRQVSVTLYDCESKTINLNVCSGMQTSLGYESSPGETYSWSPASNLSSATTSNTIFNPPSIGTFVYTLTVSSLECTRSETFNVKVFDPPQPPSFVPNKVTDAKFGANDFDGPFNLKKVNGKLLLVGEVRGQGGDLGGPNHHNFGYGYLGVYMDDNLIKSNSMSQALYFPGLPGYFDCHDDALYFLDNVSLYKTDLQGNKIWERTPGVCGKDYPLKIIALKNGEILAVFNKRDCEFLNWTGSALYYYNSSGTKLRTKGYPIVTAVNETDDGGVIFTTATLLIKLNSLGVQEWSKPITGDDVKSISQTIDGGYIIAHKYLYGYTIDNQGYWESRSKIEKLDANRNITWIKELESGGVESLRQTIDGGYILACTSDKNITIEKSENSRGMSDYWIVKLDENGNIMGDKTFGGSRKDVAVDILQYDYKTFFIIGRSESNISGDKTQNSYGEYDMWVVKFIDDNANSPAIINPTLSSTLTPPSVCNGLFNYTPTSITNGVTFNWSRAPVPGISEPSASGVGPINETLTNTTSSDIYVTYVYTTMDNRCMSSTENVVVLIKPSSGSVPLATITPLGPLTVCGSVKLDAPVKSGCSYEWRKDNGAIISTQSFINATATGNYTVKIINGTCSDLSAPLAVTVNPVPVATITPNGPTTLCTNQSVKLSANTGTGLTYQWYLNNNPLSSTSSSLTVQAANPGTYKVVVKNSFNCESSASVSVFAIEVLITPSGPLCAGGSTRLDAYGYVAGLPAMTYYIYTWQEYKKVVLNIYDWVDIGSGSSITVSKAAKYRVKASNIVCTSISAEYNLVAQSNPRPTIGYSGNVCTDGEVYMTTGSASSYYWANGATTQSTYGYPGGYYYVTVTYANGCSNTSLGFTVPTCNPDPCDPMLTAARERDPELPCLPVLKADELIVSKTSAYPNPSDNELTIQLPSPAEYDVPVKMYSQFGQVMHETTIKKGESMVVLDTRDLTGGVYMVQLKLRAQRVFNRKITIVHRK